MAKILFLHASIFVFVGVLLQYFSNFFDRQLEEARTFWAGGESCRDLLRLHCAPTAIKTFSKAARSSRWFGCSQYVDGSQLSFFGLDRGRSSWAMHGGKLIFKGWCILDSRESSEIEHEFELRATRSWCDNDRQAKFPTNWRRLDSFYFTPLSFLLCNYRRRLSAWWYRQRPWNERARVEINRHRFIRGDCHSPRRGYWGRQKSGEPFYSRKKCVVISAL